MLFDYYTAVSLLREPFYLFSQEAMMSSNANKDVITRFITEIWNGNHLDALAAFLDPAYYDYTYEPRNREGLERALLLMQTAFPGHETIIEAIRSESHPAAVG